MIRFPPTIGDYYRVALDDLKKEVEATSDDKVLRMSLDAWIAYLERKYGMADIVLDSTREHVLVEVEQEFRRRGYESAVSRVEAVRVDVPVEPSTTLEAIHQRRLAPNTISSSVTYPPFDYDHE